jgi:hypothetical protein
MVRENGDYKVQKMNAEKALRSRAIAKVRKALVEYIVQELGETGY